MAIAPQIVNVYPASGSQGIAVGASIRVTFNQEMDLTSINEGTFVLIGRDEAPIIGPIDITPFDEPGFEDEDILSSPYYDAYVKGTITFERVDASGGTVDDSEVDYDGDGALWQAVAVFTPNKQLAPNVQYTVVVLGDDQPSDDFDTGVTSRTVFDTQLDSVSGTGRVTFHGGYTGNTTRTYFLEITSGGQSGSAEYQWWDENDPLTVYEGLTTTGERELEDGIYVTCDPDGTFTTGDTFKVKVVPRVPMATSYQWSFYTGSGAVITPPSEHPASGIESLTGATTLQIVKSTPADRATNLAPGDIRTIEIQFNKTLDPDTITDDAIEVWSEAVNGDPNLDAAGTLAKIISVDGDTITIQIG